MMRDPAPPTAAVPTADLERVLARPFALDRARDRGLSLQAVREISAEIGVR
jgi:hypothetical protein